MNKKIDFPTLHGDSVREKTISLYFMLGFISGSFNLQKYKIFICPELFSVLDLIIFDGLDTIDSSSVYIPNFYIPNFDVDFSDNLSVSFVKDAEIDKNLISIRDDHDRLLCVVELENFR